MNVENEKFEAMVWEVDLKGLLWLFKAQNFGYVKMDARCLSICFDRLRNEQTILARDIDKTSRKLEGLKGKLEAIERELGYRF